MASRKLTNLYYENKCTLNINIIFIWIRFEKFNSGGLKNLNHRETLFNYHLYELNRYDEHYDCVKKLSSENYVPVLFLIIQLIFNKIILIMLARLIEILILFMTSTDLLR